MLRRPIQILAIFLAVALAGCASADDPESPELTRRLLYQFQRDLEEPGLSAAEQAVLRDQISEYLSQLSSESMIGFLGDYAAAHPDDPYNPYYYYRMAQRYRADGFANFAYVYYLRAASAPNDVLWQNQSVRFLSVQALTVVASRPSERIAAYRRLISDFPQQINVGKTWYYLGVELEKAGEYVAAYDAYASFLRYPNVEIQGFPDVYARIRERIDFHRSNKRWVRPTLQNLVESIRTAAATRNGNLLLSLQSQNYFFTTAWLQDRDDPNAQPDFNLASFLYNTNSIRFPTPIELGDSGREAWLQTTGWSTRVPTWYFYFRRVNYPLDPEIHGSWEWVGIYLGDRL